MYASVILLPVPNFTGNLAAEENENGEHGEHKETLREKITDKVLDSATDEAKDQAKDYFDNNGQQDLDNAEDEMKVRCRRACCKWGSDCCLGVVGKILRMLVIWFIGPSHRHHL